MKRVEEHRWIEPRSTPEPAWVKRRHLLLPKDEWSDEVLVQFVAMHSANDGVTIKILARREGMDWFETESISKETLAEYVEFLKEQL